MKITMQDLPIQAADEHLRPGEADRPDRNGLTALSCPICRVLLGRQESGWWCSPCGTNYPVRDGIVRMLPTVTPAERQAQQAFDFEHRRYRTARYLRITPDLVDDWLRDVRMPREFFAGKTVLDVGCGSGRWSYAMAALGARVVAVDISDAAVETTAAVTRGLEVQVIQASLFRLPFAPEQFDVVVSWGVLHHTPSTRGAFGAIAPLVRRGGLLHVMVYERRNPLKVLGTGILRALLRRVSPERRFRLCGRLIIGNRVLFHAVRPLVACIPASHLSESLDAETAQFGLYDWYSPRYNHLHSIQDVRGWFAEHGYDDVSVTTPVKYSRPLDIIRFGQCGGSISMRGRRGGSPLPEPRGMAVASCTS